MAKTKTPAPSLGANLRRLRQGAGLSFNRLSYRAEVQPAVIHRIEQGGTSDPSLAVVWALARALGVGVDAILDGVDPSTLGTARRRKAREGAA